MQHGRNMALRDLFFDKDDQSDPNYLDISAMELPFAYYLPIGALPPK
jgi:hypothetical protein